jgi:hypothetical protein
VRGFRGGGRRWPVTKQPLTIQNYYESFFSCQFIKDEQINHLTSDNKITIMVHPHQTHLLDLRVADRPPSLLKNPTPLIRTSAHLTLPCRAHFPHRHTARSSPAAPCPSPHHAASHCRPRLASPIPQECRARVPTVGPRRRA